MTVGDWINEFFVEKSDLFLIVMRSLLESGIDEARMLAAMLEKHGVPRGSSVIELGCGIGRVAVPLAAEGYRVACFDISPRYVEEALEYAERMGVADRFTGIVGDAWSVDRIVHDRYDAAYMIWTTLLGYKVRPEEDLSLLRSIHNIVRDNGKLLMLRQVHRDLVVARETYCSRRSVYEELGQYVVVEMPRFDPISSILSNKWIFYKKQNDGLRLLGESGFTIRVYTVTEIIGMAKQAGWELEALYGNLAMGPFIPGNSGVNIVLRKNRP